MNNSLTTITVFGELGKFIGHSEWKFNVKSASEAIKALNTATKNKFNDYFIKNNKLNAKYRILINGKDFVCPEKEINEKNYELINKSELVMKKENLKTIEIVPVLESNDSSLFAIFAVIIGIVLIAFGVGLALLPAGATLLGLGSGSAALFIVGGLALLSAGIMALLSRPPSFSYNQGLSNETSQSYLFNGPQNTVGEGNPVPIGYGTLLVGSNVISAGYKIQEFQTTNN